MATQIIKNQISNDAIDSSKLDLSDDYTFSGALSGILPTADANFSTKAYVDAQVRDGTQWKPAAKCATTAGLGSYSYSANVITFSSNGAMAAVDGVTCGIDDRILVKNETGGNAPYNGVYFISQQGDGSNPTKLTRGTDMDASGDFKGATISILEGTVNDNAQFKCSNDVDPTVGSTAIAFVQTSNQNVVGGNGVAVTGNSIAVDLDPTSGLEFNSAKLRIDLVADKGLELIGDGLQAKINGAGGLEVGASGLGIAGDGIDASMLQSNSVTEVKIAANSISSGKIASGAVGSTQLGASAVTNAKISAGTIAADKLGFQAHQDKFAGNGSITAFDLSQEVSAKFEKLICVFRNGLLLNQEGSPANVDEYSVNLTGGSGGVTRITLGSAPSAVDKLTVKFLA